MDMMPLGHYIPFRLQPIRERIDNFSPFSVQNRSHKGRLMVKLLFIVANLTVPRPLRGRGSQKNNLQITRKSRGKLLKLMVANDCFLKQRKQ